MSERDREVIKVSNGIYYFRQLPERQKWSENVYAVFIIQ